MLSLTKQDLECLQNAIELQLKNINMSQINYDKRKELLDKINSGLAELEGEKYEHNRFN